MEHASYALKELLRDAIEAGATALHLERFQNGIRVRVRIHGRLIHWTSPIAESLDPRTIRQQMEKLFSSEQLLHLGRLPCFIADVPFADMLIGLVPIRSSFGVSSVIHIRSVARPQITSLPDLRLPAHVESSLTETLKGPPGVILVGTAGLWDEQQSLIDLLCRMLRKTERRTPWVGSRPAAGDTAIDVIAPPSLATDSKLFFARILHKDPAIVVVNAYGWGMPYSQAEIEGIQMLLLPWSERRQRIPWVIATTKSFTTTHSICSFGYCLPPWLGDETIRMAISVSGVPRLCPECRIWCESRHDAFGWVRKCTGDFPSVHRYARPSGCPTCGWTGYQGTCLIYEVCFPQRGAVASLLTEFQEQQLLQTKVIGKTYTFADDLFGKFANGDIGLDALQMMEFLINR